MAKKTTVTETVTKTVTNAPVNELNPTYVPGDEWDTERLGQFARQALTQGIEYAWSLGRALQLAKMKSEHGQFLPWCKKHVPELSARTRNRYMNIGVLDHETIKGKKISEIYAMLDAEKKPAKAKAAKTSFGDNQQPKAKVTAEAMIDSLIAELPTKGMVLVAECRDKLATLYASLGVLLADYSAPSVVSVVEAA